MTYKESVINFATSLHNSKIEELRRQYIGIGCTCKRLALSHRGGEKEDNGIFELVIQADFLKPIGVHEDQDFYTAAAKVEAELWKDEINNTLPRIVAAELLECLYEHLYSYVCKQKGVAQKDPVITFN